MAKHSGIQWTDSTWNPTSGCSPMSEGCKYCYAKDMALRLKKMHPNGKYRNGFKVTLHEKELNLPKKWKEPRMIFVNSMSDLFHLKVPFDFIDKVWQTMLEANHHIYQILTKRPERMKYYMDHRGKVANHIWLGVTVENERTKKRIDILRKTPAKIRFVSFEPLLNSVGKLDLKDIHWAIVGGESGKNHRPFNLDWARKIRDQCKKQGKAFFFKQVGGLTPKSGGYLLDGKEYKEYPKN